MHHQIPPEGSWGGGGTTGPISVSAAHWAKCTQGPSLLLLKWFTCLEGQLLNQLQSSLHRSLAAPPSGWSFLRFRSERGLQLP